VRFVTFSRWLVVLCALTLAACASAEVTPRIMVTGDVESRLMTMAEYARSEHAMPAIDAPNADARASPEPDGSIGNREATPEGRAIDTGDSDATAPDGKAPGAMTTDTR
jgi:hypothetical protein